MLARENAILLFRDWKQNTIVHAGLQDVACLPGFSHIHKIPTCSLSIGVGVPKTCRPDRRQEISRSETRPDCIFCVVVRDHEDSYLPYIQKYSSRWLGWSGTDLSMLLYAMLYTQRIGVRR